MSVEKAVAMIQSLDLEVTPLTDDDSGFGIGVGTTLHEDYELVWHYTDSAGLIGIVSCNTLWASSTSALNDAQEIAWGIESVLAEAVRTLFAHNSEDALPQSRRSELRALLENFTARINTAGMFVLCASKQMDSLSSWRTYSGSDGYAIGMLRTDLLVPLSETEIPLAGETNSFLRWHDVVYERQAQTALCIPLLRGLLYMLDRNLVGTRAGQLAFEQFVITMATMKHGSFQDEREVRLFASGADLQPGTGGVLHRAGTYGVTPYIRITGFDDLKHRGAINLRNGHLLLTVTKAGRLPIRRLMLGPGPYMASAVAGVRSLLDANEYESVDAETSSSPARY